jgi:hypothetical protein
MLEILPNLNIYSPCGTGVQTASELTTLVVLGVSFNMIGNSNMSYERPQVTRIQLT